MFPENLSGEEIKKQYNNHTRHDKSDRVLSPHVLGHISPQPVFQVIYFSYGAGFKIQFAPLERQHFKANVLVVRLYSEDELPDKL